MVEEPLRDLFLTRFVCHKKKTIDNANITFSKFTQLGSEIMFRGWGIRLELGLKSGNGVKRANVVHYGRNKPPIVSFATIQNIVCQNSRNDSVLLYLLWYVIVVLCVLYNISNSFCSWSGSNRPLRPAHVNNCKVATKTVYSFKRTLI